MSNETSITPDTQAQTVFDRFSSLVGVWEGRFPGAENTHSVHFKLTARGTALVETWSLSPTSEAITIYTLDRERLLATHFCPHGNQPRLALTDVDATGRHHFSFVEGTNLHDPNAAHQHAFWVRIDANTFTRNEVYIKNGTTYAASLSAEEPVTYKRMM